MTSQSQESVFTPYRLGDLELPNRIVMAPLTRNRAQEGGVPTPLMADYYAFVRWPNRLRGYPNQRPGTGLCWNARNLYEGADCRLGAGNPCRPHLRGKNVSSTVARWPHFAYILAARRAVSRGAICDQGTGTDFCRKRIYRCFRTSRP